MGLPDKGLICCAHQFHSAVAPLTPEKSFVTCEMEDGHVNQSFRKESKFRNLLLLLKRTFALLCTHCFANPPVVLPPSLCSLSARGNHIGAQNPSAKVSEDVQGGF